MPDDEAKRVRRLDRDKLKELLDEEEAAEAKRVADLVDSLAGAAK